MKFIIEVPDNTAAVSVTYVYEEDGYWRCLFDTGAVLMTFAYPKEQFKKTGKHYDIASILEAMRE